MALGSGLVVLLEILDNSVRFVSDIERRLQLKPIAIIPYISTRYERRNRRLRLAAASMAVILMLVGMAAAIHFYYLPIDLVAERIIDKVRS